jgi:Mg-chelatase subunit ChlD
VRPSHEFIRRSYFNIIPTLRRRLFADNRFRAGCFAASEQDLREAVARQSSAALVLLVLLASAAAAGAAIANHAQKNAL